MAKSINGCQGCRHLYTTWDPDLPSGCRKFGFKSKTQPWVLVKQETGADCLSYQARPEKKKARAGDKGQDLNDPKYW